MCDFELYSYSIMKKSFKLSLSVWFLKGISLACQVKLIACCSEVPYRGRQLACEFAPFTRASVRIPNHLLKGESTYHSRQSVRFDTYVVVDTKYDYWRKIYLWVRPPYILFQLPSRYSMLAINSAKGCLSD